MRDYTVLYSYLQESEGHSCEIENNEGLYAVLWLPVLEISFSAVYALAVNKESSFNKDSTIFTYTAC